MIRKLFLGAAAAALMAGPALGAPGNNSEILQSGEGDTAVIDQTGSSWGSRSSVEQGQDGNAVWVTQVDNGGAGGGAFSNESTVIQNNANTATITQTQSPTAGAAADTNSSTVEQSGIEADISVVQDGAGNVSGATQAGDDQFAQIWQFGVGSNESTLFQDGYGNDVDIWQISTGDSAHLASDIVQNGEENYILSEQTGVRAESHVTQMGYKHDVHVDQRNNGRGRAFSSIEQVDAWNTADVYQRGGQTGSSIMQRGFDQVATVMQVGTGWGSLNSQIRQSGDGNVAHLAQNGEGPMESHIVQRELHQTAEVEQSGDHLQSGVFQLSGESNLATVTQTGERKASTVRQDGGWNTATVLQDGAVAATSAVTQGGFGNVAIVNQ